MVTVLFTPGKPTNTIRPSQAFGAGIDGLDKGEVAQVYTRPNLRAMLSAGFLPLTYRLRTELGIEAWHWNADGRWSDPVHRQGYWTSSSHTHTSIHLSNGYRLPRRGTTIDQANNDGYSRLDDGDTSTFWKSSPYLDHRFTQEEDALHPQWVLIDLGRKRPINALRILWAAPYAVRYRVEYYPDMDARHINDTMEESWCPFPGGIVNDGRGGDDRRRLTEQSISARFVRIMMTASSGTAWRSGLDVRDRCGYAIREIYLGLQDGTGPFDDAIRHAKSNHQQTWMYVSSTDPWHRAADKDESIEQPGFDRVYHSGLTHGLPVMMPAGLLYDTPENSIAALRFLKARGYRVTQVEMGEEPDGQYITPEDYGALYIRWADALHKIDPALQLGGPCFQSSVSEINAWPDGSGNRSWMNRFLRYLHRRGHSADYAFFSFEWYPFDDVCQPAQQQLLREPALLAGFLKKLCNEGLSRRIPWLMTEYGYSSFAGRPEVDMESALLNAEIVAQFLSIGGSAAYLYGYEPNVLMREMTACDTWGTLALFLADDRRTIRWRLPAYYAARLLTRQWAQPSDRPHHLYPVTVEGRHGLALTAYALQRPDRRWSILLINKDRRACSTRIRFLDTRTKSVSSFHGTIDLFQYSLAQYTWHPQGSHGHPERDLPPQHQVGIRHRTGRFPLPPYSLTVLRGLRREEVTGHRNSQFTLRRRAFR